MDDLVERLRDSANPWAHSTMNEAADEIERLRVKAVIADMPMSEVETELREQLAAVTRERDAARNSDEHNFQRWQRDAEQLAACQKDAERYAVLRNFGFPNQTSHFGPWWWKDGGLFHTLDEAVDAKIAAMNEQTK